MCKKLAYWLCFVLLGLAPGTARADIQTGLVGYWPLNEGAGTTTADMSGNGHNGTLRNGATWISPGFLGQAAIRIDGNPGSRVAVGTWDPGDRFTLAIWAKWTGEQSKAERTGIIGKRNGWTVEGMRWFSEVMTTGQVRMRNFTQTVSSPAGAMTARINEWVHIAITFDGATARIYLDAQQVGSGAFTLGPMKTAGMGLGCKEGDSNGSTETFSGDLDEARIYDRVLSVDDVKQLLEWTGLPGNAQSPTPSDGQTDVARDVVLSWTPGEFAPPTSGHRVYFGENFDEVRGATDGVAQDASTYTPPQRLDFGKTYYWRVDEANESADKPFFKGDVWSFTVEPYAYPIGKVVASASSAQAGMEPQNTVNGSGLNQLGQHSAVGTDMWLSDGSQPNWIQYEFDQVYKLHELWVWNSNQLIEAFIGFGARDVTIESSVDGSSWTPVADVPEFARGAGTATYTHNTTVDFGDAVAKYVKLSINAGWGGLPQVGLSEVRFSYIPVLPREPMPANGAVGMESDTRLAWRAGREAASHQVFFGTDRQTVADETAPVRIAIENGFDPGALTLGTSYYWKVVEVNEAAIPSTWEGEVWSFATREYLVVDDMEGYNDDDNRIYQAWVDGVTTGASGSTVGYFQAPFAEKTILHGGKQSMPFEYNNVNTPFYSEAEQEFSPVQNWTVNGADTLSLWVRGNPMPFAEDAGVITMSAAGTDIWGTADDFRFAHKTLNGDGSVVVKVESLVNTNNWAKAGVMIRQSLDADSKFVYFIESFAQGVSMGWRPTAAATCGSATQAGIAAPQWVKLTRKGDVFTAQYSVDGKTWTDLKNADGTAASTTVAMTNPVYVGLCVTSHNPAAATTAVMSGVATTGNVTGGSWQVLAIGNDPQPANSPADLYVAVQDSAGKTATATNPTAVTSAAWTQWKIPLSSFAGVNMTRVKKVMIGVDSRTSSIRGGGMLYIDDIGFGHPAQ